MPPGHPTLRMEMEEWRAIPGYEQCYEVSNTGAVRSLDRTIHTSAGWSYFKEGVLLKPLNNGNDYLYVTLWKNNSQQRVAIHRLVATVFIGQPPICNLDVAHFNGDRSNNDVLNLRWATKKENMADQVRHGTSPLGKRNECCVRGHKRSGRNLKEYSGGKIRDCWSCKLMMKFLSRRGMSPTTDPELAQEVSDVYYEQVTSGLDPYYEPDCNRGHLLQGSNLGIYKKYDKRYCKSCERARKNLNTGGRKSSEQEIRDLADVLYRTRYGGGAKW